MHLAIPVGMTHRLLTVTYSRYQAEGSGTLASVPEPSSCDISDKNRRYCQHSLTNRDRQRFSQGHSAFYSMWGIHQDPQQVWRSCRPPPMGRTPAMTLIQATKSL